MDAVMRPSEVATSMSFAPAVVSAGTVQRSWEVLSIDRPPACSPPMVTMAGREKLVPLMRIPSPETPLVG